MYCQPFKVLTMSNFPFQFTKCRPPVIFPLCLSNYLIQIVICACVPWDSIIDGDMSLHSKSELFPTRDTHGNFTLFCLLIHLTYKVVLNYWYCYNFDILVSRGIPISSYVLHLSYCISNSINISTWIQSFATREGTRTG